MKNLKQLNIFILIIMTSFSYAQQGINYKALIKDGSGNVVASQNIDLQFIIFKGSGNTVCSVDADCPIAMACVNGTCQSVVFQETHALVMTDDNGIIIVNIGEGSVDSGVFANIEWGIDDHYLNVHINTGSGLTDMGTTQFMAVPYALNSATKIDDLIDGKSDPNGSSVFLGLNAGLNDDGGNNGNIGIGFEALKSNTTGLENTAIGYQVLFNNEGDRNTATGSYALYNNEVGIRNTATGFGALYNTLGSGNVALGYEAGLNETGDNTLYISNSDTSTPLIYGEFDNQKLTLNGKTTVKESTNSMEVHALSGIKTHTGDFDAYGVYGENIVSDWFGIGVFGRGGYAGVRGDVIAIGNDTYFGVRGDVSGGGGTNYGVYGKSINGATVYGVYASGDLGYSGDLISTSDRKLKTNINKLNNGMATIMSLQPSTYSFKESYQKSMQVSNKPQFGFMAQELQTVLPELVSENKHPGVNKEDKAISYLGINYIGLIPILTAGMQEQQAHIKTLEDKINSQNQTIENLISRLEDIENR